MLKVGYVDVVLRFGKMVVVVAVLLLTPTKPGSLVAAVTKAIPNAEPWCAVLVVEERSIEAKRRRPQPSLRGDGYRK